MHSLVTLAAFYHLTIFNIFNLKLLDDTLLTFTGVFGSNPAAGGIAMQYSPLLMLALTFNFWVNHWEKYNTGVLYLPWMFDIAQTVSFLELHRQF